MIFAAVTPGWFVAASVGVLFVGAVVWGLVRPAELDGGDLREQDDPVLLGVAGPGPLYAVFDGHLGLDGLVELRQRAVVDHEVFGSEEGYKAMALGFDLSLARIELLERERRDVAACEGEQARPVKPEACAERPLLPSSAPAPRQPRVPQSRSGAVASADLRLVRDELRARVTLYEPPRNATPIGPVTRGPVSAA